jgi:hypothetical protein
MHNTTVHYIKKGDQLVPASEKDAGALKLFNMAIKDGDTVEVYLTKTDGKQKTVGQLAKIHKMIRDLANFTGDNFEDMKDEVKRRAGLYVITGPKEENTELKSFADCSKDELSAAIEICVQLGHLVGYYMD